MTAAQKVLIGESIYPQLWLKDQLERDAKKDWRITAAGEEGWRLPRGNLRATKTWWGKHDKELKCQTEELSGMAQYRVLGLEPRRKTGWVTQMLRSNELDSLWTLKPKAQFLVSGVTFPVPWSSKDNKGHLYHREGCWDTVDSRCLWQKKPQKVHWNERVLKNIYSQPLTCNRIIHKYIYSIVHVPVHLTFVLSKSEIKIDQNQRFW